MSVPEEDKLDKIIRAIDKIDRGLYGDADNKVPGLMQNHYELKARMDLMQEREKKRTYLIAGFSSAASLGLPFVWEWVKKTFIS